MNTSSNLNSEHNRYTTEHISGEQPFKFYDYQQEEQNYENQSDVLKKRNDKMTPKNYNLPYEKMYTATPGLFGQRHAPDYNNIKNRKNDNYDILGEYFYKRGDKNFSSITRYYSHYINIDSRFRNKNSQYSTLNYIQLPTNPILLKNNSNLITIVTNNIIDLEVNDKISLIGLPNYSKNLRVTDSNNLLEFSDGSIYLKINYPHTLYFDNLEEVKKYNSSDLYIELSGIIDSNYNTAFINNIPLNTLNTIQKVYLYNPDTMDYSNDYFFVKLIRSFSGTYTHGEDYTIKLVYNYYYGIPNNKLVTQYPVNNSSNQGYLIVKEVNKNNIIIELFKYASFNTNNNIIKYGGDNICISKVEEIIKGDPLPTSYAIRLDRTYNNIVLIRMIASEFPVLNKVIYGCRNENSDVIYNNKLYWQNLDDGDIIYSISLDQGNYTMTQLINMIEEKVLNVDRIENYDDMYNKKNIIKIKYIEGNHEIKFMSYKEADLIQPFISVSTPNPNEYLITVSHKNHHLEIGNIIEISGSIDTDNILASDINKIHIVNTVIDSNTYTILLKNINLLGSATSTKGGNAVKILVQNIFRMRFDFNDTLGNFFGFRNLGDSKSITKYQSVISNKELYFNEYLDESLLCVTQEGDYFVKTIYLENDNFIYMTAKIPNMPNNTLNQMTSDSKLKNIFAKIQIKNDTNVTNNTVYNSYVNSPIYIHNPIPELKELEIQFYDKDGNMLEYSDFEHSYTLEIVTIAEIPEGTNLAAKYPKIN